MYDEEEKWTWWRFRIASKQIDDNNVINNDINDMVMQQKQ